MDDSKWTFLVITQASNKGLFSPNHLLFFSINCCPIKSQTSIPMTHSNISCQANSPKPILYLDYDDKRQKKKQSVLTMKKLQSDRGIGEMGRTTKNTDISAHIALKRSQIKSYCTVS